MFKRKKNKSKPQNENQSETSPAQEQNSVIFSKPKICTINVEDKVVSYLEKAGFNIFNGNLGDIVKVQNAPGKGHPCLPNSTLPVNLHEYDILIIDLLNFKTKEYVASDHIKELVSTEKDYYIFCGYPKTVFDPRNYSLAHMIASVREMARKDSILLFFSARLKESEYDIAEKQDGYMNTIKTEKATNYSFLPNGFHFKENKSGKEVVIPNLTQSFSNILNKYKQDISYHLTFNHPTTWKATEFVKREDFFPFLFNQLDEIIGYVEYSNNMKIFAFPDFANKDLLLKDLLIEFLPEVSPDLFPNNEKSSWKNKKEYYLPNQGKLIEKRDKLIEDHSHALQALEKEINENNIKYSFLHNILSDTGDKLINNLIKYLEWAGFSSITNMDKQNHGKKEEDIQIEIDQGLLIIEGKGIGGTSKDEECAQISKIRSRRCEERNKFDVFALYIVNHQRHIPPLLRQHPPFSEDQVKDAILEKRGLVTTWQLYNAFFDVKMGVLDKSDIRQALQKCGLIEFKYPKLKLLGKVKETFKNNTILIVNLQNSPVSKGGKVYLKTSFQYQEIELLSIQVEGKEVSTYENGEVGLRVNKPVKQGTIIYTLI